MNLTSIIKNWLDCGKKFFIADYRNKLGHPAFVREQIYLTLIDYGGFSPHDAKRIAKVACVDGGIDKLLENYNLMDTLDYQVITYEDKPIWIQSNSAGMMPIGFFKRVINTCKKGVQFY